MERFGELYHFPEGSENPHFLFACHAALPVVLTPDLLYHIWIHFQDEKNRFPYEAVSDLLLSGLCREVRPQLFEMEASARDYFLKSLRRHPRFGPGREKELARFLLSYASSHYPQKHQRTIRESQRFAAIAYLDARQAAQEIIRSLNDSLNNRSEQRRLGSLIDALNIPLDDLPELVAYGRAVKSQFSGRGEEAVEQIAVMPISPDALVKGEVDIAGTTLMVSPELRRLIKERIGELEALRKESQSTARYFSKIHLLAHQNINKFQLFEGLFGWKEGHPLNYPVNIIEKEYMEDFDGRKGSIHQIVWQYDIDEVSAPWDNMLLTEGGLYVVAVQPESRGDEYYGYSKLFEALERIRFRVGAQPVIVAIVRNEENASIQIDKKKILEVHPNIERFIEIEPNSHNELYGLFREETLDKKSPLKNKAWERVAANFYGKYQATTTRQDFLKACEENRISSQEGFDLIFYLAESGRMIAPLSKLGGSGSKGLEAGSLLVNKPEVFLKELYSVFESQWINGTMSIGEWGGLIEYRAQLSTQQDDLILFLENFGLLYFDEKRNSIVIPSLVRKQSHEALFDVTTTTTTYLTYRFDRMPPDLLMYLHVCFGAAGWNIKDFGERGIGFEEEAYKMELLSGQEVLQVRLVVEDNLDEILVNVAGMIDVSLKRSYKSLSTSLDQRTIPPHATPAMAPVEGGTFTMGWLNEKRDGEGFGDEKPAHEVKVNHFSIGKYSVTFEEYDAFCESTSREKPKDAGWGRGRRAAIYVDWYDALEYCNWLSEIWGLEKVYEIGKGQKDPNNRSGSDDKKWLITVNESANGYRLPTEA
ncbi:MAG: formylglycine-generating enzyme family protein, partial [Phaeodactylibacter sp.]|nr:formylglycine-generating enzyme family protein [Phaeodactylibacter sp.]